MDVRDCRTVRLPSSISRRFAERRPGSIGHITLRGKCAGARSAGKPHAACDVVGAGNGLTVRLVRHSHRKRGETDRPRLRSTAPALDPTGVRPLRTPRRVPQANAYCERLIGTTRRECLDFLIPLSEEPLRRFLTEWRNYYNRARPHSSLGPGLPTTCVELPMKPDQHRHQLPDQRAVASRPVLGGLHHDYRLSRVA